MMKYILFFLLFFFISGCNNTIINNKHSRVNFSKLSYDLVVPICDDIKENETLYLTDFVNEKDLSNHNKFGFLLSNEIKVQLYKCDKNIKIKELQLSKHLKIGKNGAKMLSRDLNILKNKNLLDTNRIIIGSYITTNKQLILFLRYINIKTSNIIRASSVSVTLIDELKSLLGIKIDKDNESDNIYTPMHL